MEASTRQGQSPQTPHCPFQTLVTLCLIAGATAGSGSSHTPFSNFWVITNPEAGYRTVLVERVGPPGVSWFPLCLVICANQLNIHGPAYNPGREKFVHRVGFADRVLFMSVQEVREPLSAEGQKPICASWGCETLVGANLNENK